MVLLNPPQDLVTRHPSARLPVGPAGQPPRPPRAAHWCAAFQTPRLAPVRRQAAVRTGAAGNITAAWIPRKGSPRWWPRTPAHVTRARATRAWHGARPGAARKGGRGRVGRTGSLGESAQVCACGRGGGALMAGAQLVLQRCAAIAGARRGLCAAGAVQRAGARGAGRRRRRPAFQRAGGLRISGGRGASGWGESGAGEWRRGAARARARRLPGRAGGLGWLCRCVPGDVGVCKFAVTGQGGVRRQAAWRQCPAPARAQSARGLGPRAGRRA